MGVKKVTDKIHIQQGHEKHPSTNILSDFILGSQDGLVNVLGIILGISAATTDIRLIFVAGLAALGAESISMGAVAYTSTLARRKYYLKERERELLEMKEVPKIEKNEIRNILKEWGYSGKELTELTNKITANPKAMLEFMMSFELKLSPVSRKQPLKSFAIVITATIFGSIIPLIPFLFIGNIHTGAIAALILSAVVLFGIGYYEAKKTIGSLWRNGLQMVIIGISAGIIGYIIGYFVGAVPI
ncbi:MAG: VIT1/CCC1 transporter family protein [Candidatus Micrarchaeaceae archaeon]